MSGVTKIEWTNATWNPVRGCAIVSKGCTNCYAMRLAHRFAGAGKPFEGLTKLAKGGPVWTGKVRLVPELLDWPLRRLKPSRIFVNSMSDLFHEDVPDEFIDRVFAVLASSSKHTFQVLTKRADRMQQYMQRIADGAPMAGQRYEAAMREHFDRYKLDFREGYSLPAPPTPELRFLYDSAVVQEHRPTAPCGTTLAYGFSGGEYHWRAWPLNNVWLGVSVEDQAAADERIPLLLNTPAAVRWISAEPLVGPVSLGKWLPPGRANWQCMKCAGFCGGGFQVSCPHCGADKSYLCGSHVANKPRPDTFTGSTNHQPIDWVVAGGESGPGARPMHPDWPRSLRNQCAAAGVPYFFKQWGAWSPVGPIYYDEDTAEHLAALDCDDDTARECFVTRSGLRWLCDRDGQPPLGTWAMERIGKRAAGRLLDGRMHNEYPT